MSEIIQVNVRMFFFIFPKSKNDQVRAIFVVHICQIWGSDGILAATITDSFMVSRSHFGRLTGVLNARMPDWHHGSHFMILATTFMVSRSHFGQMAGILDARMPDCLKVCYIPWKLSFVTYFPFQNPDLLLPCGGSILQV